MNMDRSKSNSAFSDELGKKDRLQEAEKMGRNEVIAGKNRPYE